MTFDRARIQTTLAGRAQRAWGLRRCAGTDSAYLYGYRQDCGGPTLLSIGVGAPCPVGKPHAAQGLHFVFGPFSVSDDDSGSGGDGFGRHVGMVTEF